MRKRVYVWELPVRLTHWVNVISIVVLSITGYYIFRPFLSVGPLEAENRYIMGVVRWVHFVVAYVFVASLLLRAYWAFAGNRWASWRALFPFFSRAGRQNMGETFGYYIFRRRDPPEITGHNALAGATYLLVVFLFFVQIVTGFALYGYVHPTGIWPALTGWIFLFFSVQTVRVIHHLVMWLIIAFATHHIYSAWLWDAEKGSGIMSSIFSGYKFIPPDRRPDWLKASPAHEAPVSVDAAAREESREPAASRAEP